LWNSRAAQATKSGRLHLFSVDPVDTRIAGPERSLGATDAAAGVTARYKAHAAGHVRLAVIALGVRQAADVV
jgi:hypothetical protein